MHQEIQFELVLGPSAVPEMQRLLWNYVGLLYFQERPEMLCLLDTIGDREGSYDLLRLREKVTALRYFEPITPPKIDVLHWMAFIIGWKAGLRELKPIELASCFDQICPFHETHDPDALRKQRGRAARAIRKFEDVFYISGSYPPSDDGQKTIPNT